MSKSQRLMPVKTFWAIIDTGILGWPSYIGSSPFNFGLYVRLNPSLDIGSIISSLRSMNAHLSDVPVEINGMFLHSKGASRFYGTMSRSEVSFELDEPIIGEEPLFTHYEGKSDGAFKYSGTCSYEQGTARLILEASLENKVGIWRP